MMTPPFLLIDAGNTRLKWAVTGARGVGRLAGDVATKAVTLAWIAGLARKYPKHHAVLASVVPKLAPAFRRSFARRIEIVTGRSPDLGFTFDYPRPAEIGADRLAAAAAVHAWKIWPAIIVACGTATAFTALDARGGFCGGAIAPGLQAQLDSLLHATAQLPGTALHASPRALGRSTREAIRAGVMLSFRGGAKEILRGLIDELPGGKKPRVFLTGGQARHLAGALEGSVTLKPLLVLEGLHMIGHRAWTRRYEPNDGKSN
jgi:type III pantothenate kinase